MATAETERNKATIRRFCEAMNTGDPELISKTIDELVEPNARIARHCRFLSRVRM